MEIDIPNYFGEIRNFVSYYLLETLFGPSVLLGGVIWIFLRSIHRIYFDNLSHFPGPKLAAIGPWYERYYDIVRGGLMTEKLAELHKIYGPYVRISHVEVHTVDPEAWGQIYNTTSQFKKAPSPAVYAHPMAQCSLFGLRDPVEHRARRQLLEPLFAKKIIRNLSWMFMSKVQKQLSRYEEYANSGKVLDVWNSTRCMTLETMDEFLFAGSINSIEHNDFKHPLLSVFDSQSDTLHIFRHFTWIAWIVVNLPIRFLQKLWPDIGALASFQEECERKILSFLDDYKLACSPTHPTLFERILSPEAKATTRVSSVVELRNDAYTFLVGGTDTTAWAITVAIWHVARNPKISARLLEELQTVMPNPEDEVDSNTLEKLPFLNAVLKESLRIGGGSPGKLLRSVPSSGALINNRFFPDGALVGMSPHLLGQDENIFPNPSEFIPDRWLNSKDTGLDRYLTNFSKGSRACIGQTVAWSVIYLAVGHLLRRFEFDVAETSEWDMGWKERNAPKINRGLNAVIRKREV